MQAKWKPWKISSDFIILAGCIQYTHEKHKHDLILYGKCPELSCTKDCRDKTSRGIIERTADHAGKDEQWHLLKQVEMISSIYSFT